MEVVEAYRSGATARELAVKWKVSPGSVYYQAGRAGWSKKRNGDQLAREHAKAIEAAEAVRAEPARREQRALKNLFAPAPTDDPEAADPAALARAATLASGRAMKGRLWNEARALAALAESYARLAERAGRRGDDEWGGAEPDEAAFEAVRRKVLGWGPEAITSPTRLEAGGEGEDGAEARDPAGR
ncbi:MAG: hypothetical protein Q8K49_01635 [Brevundimonas sp.]|nr:hypothetical protein [Brevundimonas sp.]